MAHNLGIQKQFFKLPVTLAQVDNPNGGINKDHRCFQAYLRLGTALRLFSVPPSFASRLLLSRAIKASRPSRTKDVFSLMPVNRDAFSNILSSMLSVVLICISMNEMCIYVKEKDSIINWVGQGFSCLRSMPGWNNYFVNPPLYRPFFRIRDSVNRVFLSRRPSVFCDFVRQVEGASILDFRGMLIAYYIQ